MPSVFYSSILTKEHRFVYYYSFTLNLLFSTYCSIIIINQSPPRPQPCDMQGERIDPQDVSGTLRTVWLKCPCLWILNHQKEQILLTSLPLPSKLTSGPSWYWLMQCYATLQKHPPKYLNIICSLHILFGGVLKKNKWKFLISLSVNTYSTTFIPHSCMISFLENII